jgi:hypothetical protein
MTCSETFDMFPPESTKALFAPERMDDLDSSQIGTVGEYLVAAVIAGYGYEVHHTKCNGYDLLVMRDGADPIRVDVKTVKAANKPRTYSIRKGKTTTFREYEAGDCDLFALVCLEDQSIVFDRCDKYDGKSSIYINRDKHRDTCSHRSWQSALNG